MSDTSSVRSSRSLHVSVEETDESSVDMSALDSSTVRSSKLNRLSLTGDRSRKTTLDHVVTALKPDAPKYKGNRQNLSVVRAEEMMLICDIAKEEVEVKDRRWMMKRFPQCFVGAELVDWMVDNLFEVEGSREKATQLGRQLLHYGFIEHVVNEHDFKDEALFYNFSLDVSRSLQRRAELIVKKPFSELSVHADLPRLVLTVGRQVCNGGEEEEEEVDAVSKRVGCFLAGVCEEATGDEGGGALGRSLQAFCSGVSGDILADALLGRLLGLEGEAEREAGARLTANVLRCCAQSAIAPYFVYLKQRSHAFGGLTAVPGSWSLSVSATPQLLSLTHARADKAPPSAPQAYRCDWSVVFLFSRLSGQLVQIIPVLLSVDGDAKLSSFLQSLFDQMRITTH